MVLLYHVAGFTLAGLGILIALCLPKRLPKTECTGCGTRQRTEVWSRWFDSERGVVHLHLCKRCGTIYEEVCK